MRQSSILLALLPGLCLLGGESWAERTRLLEVDLKTGSRRSIDAGGPRTAADRELDALLDRSTGATFSTSDLERIEKALRRYLASARPRAMPRLLLFVYPGRITRNGLKELREVKVDLDLLVDPCSRTICADSVGKHVELVGKALRQPVLRAGRYAIRFGTITIRTTTDLRGAEPDLLRFAAEEVVQAGQQGTGVGLVTRLMGAKADYDRQMTKEVTGRVRRRRVQLSAPPVVRRESGAVSVELAIRSDRVRYRSDVLGALIGAAEALRQSPLTPPRSSLRVTASIPLRRLEQRIFTCQGQALALLLEGQMSQDEVWSTYVVEKKKGGTQLAFDDAEAAGRAPVGEEEEGDDRTGEILAAHFSLLAPCLTAAAGRDRRFKGTTLHFAIERSGRAVGLTLKGGGDRALQDCLQGALAQISFPRHGGAPRRVEYPMLIKR